MHVYRPAIFHVLSFIVLIVTVLAWGGQAPARAAEPAVVRAVGSSLVSGTPGPAVVLPVQVTNVQALGAATLLVGYDPASLKVVACQRNTIFDVGLCNTAYDRNADGTADAVLFNVVSLQGVSAAGTPVTLANITWQTVAAEPEARITILALQVQTFTDTDGRLLAHTAQDGQVTLLPAPPTPTATPTSTLTPAPTATPTPTPTQSRRKCYLPLLLRAYTEPSSPTATPTGTAIPPTATPSPSATATPAPGQPPTFRCSDWCTPGGTPGWRRQSVTSDRPVSDWQVYINFTLHPDLVAETATAAIIEAPNDASVRVEALFDGRWLLACKSVVFCGN